MNQLDFLTGYRGIAAWWVVIYHVNSHLRHWLPGIICDVFAKGYLAVDFFFILSGFIISYVYYDSITQITKKQIVGFYVKRIARIYPLHLFVLLLYLSIPTAYLLTNRQLPDNAIYAVNSFILSLLLAHNWGFLSDLTWNIPSWSISTEMAAYLVFPFLAIYSKRIVSSRVVLGIAVFMMLVLMILYNSIGANDIGANIPKLAIFRCIFEFIIGMCIFKLYAHGNKISQLSSSSVLILGFILSSIMILNYVNDYLVAPLAFFMIIYGSLSSSNFLTRFFSMRVFIYLGELSYSTYLIHYFVKDWMKMLLLKGDYVPFWWLLLYIFIIYVMSHILYRFIECPSRKVVMLLGAKLTQRTV